MLNGYSIIEPSGKASDQILSFVGVSYAAGPMILPRVQDFDLCHRLL